MNIDFKEKEITITNTELIELTTKLEEEEKVKFEEYDCLRKPVNETPTNFKARRNERIRMDYKIGRLDLNEIVKKYSVSLATAKRDVKGIKKPKKLPYVDRRNNHTLEYKELLSEKKEREIELDVIKRSEFEPLPLDEVSYETVKFKHREVNLPYNCCTVDLETGELIEFEFKDRELDYGKPKSSKVVEKALKAKPDVKLMDKLEKLCSKLRG